MGPSRNTSVFGGRCDVQPSLFDNLRTLAASCGELLADLPREAISNDGLGHARQRDIFPLPPLAKALDLDCVTVDDRLADFVQQQRFGCSVEHRE